ncbi:MAG: 23S rRNA (guanosine(2251)-2'-O)-methyltransferase RlmB [Deinococcota bacterium]
MLIYGKQAVLEALQDGNVERVLLAKGLHPQTVQEVEKLAATKKVNVDHVPRIKIDQAAGTTRHQGVAAEIPDLKYSEPDAPFARAQERGEQLLLVLLDQITDPRNYGAIIRSAEVLGAHGVITEERRSAPLSGVVAKTAAGASSHLPLVQVKNLPRYIDELKKRNVWVYGADGAAYSAPGDIDWDRDVALVIGSEGSGMRRLVRDKCDELVAIPMRGKVESLNASVAAGILLYAVTTSR